MYKLIGKLYPAVCVIPFIIMSHHFYAQGYERMHSVLGEGDLYKLAVLEDGIYKISASSLREFGIDVAGIDPRNLQLYGTGGKCLPQENRKEVPFDPPELSIYVQGESDGSFDEGDFILFYGQSPHHFALDTTSNT
ncbi:MAG: hypothetical protein OEY51_08200, partial [Cyclobacteriaceae bacterium]|nr:hypothetical protein [Cyclobacteriaceae bacterium]